jgi:MFS family permease
MRLNMPWFYGWNIVGIAIAYQAITYGIAIYGFTFWVPYWETEFDTGRGVIMLIFMSIQLGMAVFAAFAGRAADQLPIRWLVMAGGFLFASGLVLSAYARELWQIGFIFSLTIVAGLLLAGSITAQTITARWFDRNAGLALGIVSTGSSIGGLLLPMLIVYLQSTHGWREANLWLAGLVVVVITPACLFLQDKPKNPESDEADHLSEDSGPSTQQYQGKEWTLRDILMSRSFWSMALCFTVISAVFIAIQQNLAPLASDNNIDAMKVSTVVALMAFVMIGAKLLFGFLSDRMNIRVLFVSACGALAVVLLLLTVSAITYTILMVTAALVGFAAACSMPLSASIIRRDFGALSFGRVKGLMYTVLALGAAGPWIAGTIYDATGDYETAWIVLGVLLIPAIVASSGFAGRATR